MALQACQGMEGQPGMNAQMNCYYYLSALYHDEGQLRQARDHIMLAIDASKSMGGKRATTAWLMGVFQEWHAEWGDIDEAAAIGEDIASRLSDLDLEASAG